MGQKKRETKVSTFRVWMAADFPAHPFGLVKDASKFLVRNIFTPCEGAAGTALMGT